MKTKPVLSLILPCYNEEDIFKQSLKDIVGILNLFKYSYEIIFVDDKSSDRTPDLIKDACRKNRQMKAIFHPHNTGRGQAVVDGIRAARGAVCGYIDIDLEVSPVYICQMADMIIRRRADMVIGRRVYRTTIGSLGREFISKGYNLIFSNFFNLGNYDTESGYKFFSRRKILEVIKKTSHPHWFWDTEVVVYSNLAGLRIAEVPVLFVRRFDKKSSVRVLRDSLDYIKSILILKQKLKKS